MSATKRRKPAAGTGKRKKALAEVPERAPVARQKMAAFFDSETREGDMMAGKTKDSTPIPETEKHLAKVAVKVDVKNLPAEPPKAAAAKEPLSAVKPSPGKAGAKDNRQESVNKNDSAKGDAKMSGKTQGSCQRNDGGSNMVGFVALFAAIAALALVWFYASTATGSPSVLNDLQKSKVELVEKIDALDAKVSALDAKFVAAEKAKLVKSVNDSLEAINALAANADPKTAELLKKMQVEMQKSLVELK
ncbi:MAG: hypothetical protein JXO49_09460 [Deltaproteobacteria bacterium]|nr:hypothetical protein [Candidatus Anaeroferrophillus wilburensis]MBN2889558.1 hypothetical protein [Deltaproteobacteria bacterium]